MSRAASLSDQLHAPVRAVEVRPLCRGLFLAMAFRKAPLRQHLAASKSLPPLSVAAAPAHVSSDETASAHARTPLACCSPHFHRDLSPLVLTSSVSVYATVLLPVAQPYWRFGDRRFRQLFRTSCTRDSKSHKSCQLSFRSIVRSTLSGSRRDRGIRETRVIEAGIVRRVALSGTNDRMGLERDQQGPDQRDA